MSPAVSVGVALGCLSIAGCGTFSDAICGPVSDRVYYRGTRFDLLAIREGGAKVLLVADLPLSALVDTALIPYFAYQEATRPRPEPTPKDATPPVRRKPDGRVRRLNKPRGRQRTASTGESGRSRWPSGWR